VKVLLRRDVKGIGKRGDIVEVSSGHARNHLIPNGLAVEASDGTVENAVTQKRTQAARQAADRDTARAIAARLAAAPLEIVAKAGATGKLFGSVTSHDVVDAISRQHGVEVDRKHVEIPAPIREVGSHNVHVMLFAEVRASLTVSVRAG
jgi:large subunit ribosomal protein L9